jgi:hypothetical protein
MSASGTSMLSGRPVPVSDSKTKSVSSALENVPTSHHRVVSSCLPPSTTFPLPESTAPWMAPIFMTAWFSWMPLSGSNTLPSTWNL